MTSRNVCVYVSYDGTNFCGWQIQKKDRTVQGEIEKALKKIHKHDVRITGSGRTDSGVHARAQVFNFTTDILSIPECKYAEVLNSLLPNDVNCFNSFYVPEDFSARYSAQKRIYKYYINFANYNDPFKNNYSWFINSPVPDINLMNKMASYLVGVHDFTSFTAAGDPSPSKVRELFTSCFYPENDFIIYKIVGNAFLWNMVRSIVGTILDLIKKNESPEKMKLILESMDRSMAGPTAKAKGLFLDRVTYDKESIY